VLVVIEISFLTFFSLVVVLSSPVAFYQEEEEPWNEVEAYFHELKYRCGTRLRPLLLFCVSSCFPPLLACNGPLLLSIYIDRAGGRLTYPTLQSIRVLGGSSYVPQGMRIRVLNLSFKIKSPMHLILFLTKNLYGAPVRGP